MTEIAGASELVTLRDWMRYAVSRFGEAGLAYGHGSSNAFDEAAYLILWALHLPLDRLEPFLDARITATERQQISSLLHRRIEERIPAAYLTHEAWLGEFRFYVDERVIVPRSFIAELVPDGLEPFIGDLSHVERALDLCTGSGCLAIVLAHACSVANVDAVDISADALAVARRNVDAHGLHARIHLVASDLFEELAGRQYDLIVSNPPYVGVAAMASLPAEYRHEPELALAGGDDGLDVVRAILRDAPGHLRPHGCLVMEVGHNRDVVDAAFPSLALTWLETQTSDDAVFIVQREELLQRA
ncbi:MAG: 50S ribosomal protein L3 N(5)-glutamine methyltransferase [Pseudomonadota bacterium]|nr:50S ribosomal protein L3 N(5)-glutamine methyltransferase [Pseudomonadota bacterium]